VLLIVADLRRSAVHKFFGIRNKGGLTNVIIGQKSLEDGSIRQTKVPNLFVLLAANPTPSPAELLSSQAMEAVLAH
jgi:Mrp family chromosome partitioning ATPase